MKQRILVIRIKGEIKIKRNIKQTLLLLRLYKKHTCVIVPNNANYIGMIKKVKDYITWGELDIDTFKLLLEKKGKLVGKKPFIEEYLKEKTKLSLDEFSKQFFEFKKELKDIPGLKPFFRLNPPIKGFERGGIKKPYSLGGVLGYRKEKINELIKRMV